MKLIVLFFITYSLALHSSVGVTEISLKEEKGQQKLSIIFDKAYSEIPVYKKKESNVEFYFPKTFLDAKAKVDFDGKIKKEDDGVYLTLALTADQVKSLEATATAKSLSYHYKANSSTTEKTVAKVEEVKKEGNADYLSYLIDSVSEKRSNSESEPSQSVMVKGEEKNKVQSQSDFDIPTYIAKAGLVLGLIILFFIGTVQIFKKFALRKGKLNFLKGDKVIEVLATNYIAPKRTLMLLRVHEQIILVANTESGINLLTEVNDTTGLLKQGEKLLTGGNFDTEVEKNHQDEKLSEKVKLKDLTKLNQSQSELNRWKSLASFKNKAARSN